MKIIINESQLKKLISVIISEKDNSKNKGLDEKSRSFAFTRKKTLFSKNAMMSNPDRFKKYDKEIKDLEEESELTEKCWAGYEQKGMKTMFGKKYPNCVKKKK